MSAPRRWSAPGVTVTVGALVYAALFTALSWRKQDSFEYARFDLGNMAQAVWNTAHGRILQTSDEVGDVYVRLGVHVDPILAAFAPLYRLWPDPKLLLAAQAGFVALGAWPAYRIARAELAGVLPTPSAAAWGGALFALAYLLYPPLQAATLDEFHPITLAPALLLFAIWFLRERRYVPFAIVAVAAALCKEEVGLLVAGLGLYAAFVWGDRRAGLITAAAGLAWSAIAFQVIIPAYSPTGEGPFEDRYAAVGGDAPGIIGTAFTDPAAIVEEAVSRRDLGYLLRQLGPLLFLPLLAPAALLVALPELAANLLSSHPLQTSWRYHYIAGQAPFFWWAAVLGTRRLIAWASQRDPGRMLATPAIPATVAAACLAVGYLTGPLPLWSGLPAGSDELTEPYLPDGHDRVAGRGLDRVPDGASVSVANRMGGRLTDRREIALLPGLGDSEYVIADLRNPSFGTANRVSGVGRDPVARRLRDYVRMLVSSGRYRTVFSEDGVLVLRRNPARRVHTKAR